MSEAVNSSCLMYDLGEALGWGKRWVRPFTDNTTKFFLVKAKPRIHSLPLLVITQEYQTKVHAMAKRVDFRLQDKDV